SSGSGSRRAWESALTPSPGKTPRAAPHRFQLRDCGMLALLAADEVGKSTVHGGRRSGATPDRDQGPRRRGACSRTRRGRAVVATRPDPPAKESIGDKPEESEILWPGP